MLLAELVMGGNVFNDFSVLADIENSANQEPTFLNMIKKFDMDSGLKEFICNCLQLLPENRPSLSDLFKLDFIKNVQSLEASEKEWPIMAHNFDNSLKVEDIWYLLQVRNKEILQQTGLITHCLALPSIVRLSDDLESILNSFSKGVSLPISQVEVELDVSGLLDKSETFAAEYKLWSLIGAWEFNEIRESIKLFGEREKLSLDWDRKEKDVSYQQMRTELFRKLLIKFPLSLERIIMESGVGFPSHLRAAVYCALLEVEGDTSILFDAFDCDIITKMDQQVCF